MESALAPVSLQQIIVFLRVAEYGGFAKASGYLNMTQSAVSKSIAKLERDLGIALFSRTTREIHLTEAGLILYNDWKQQVKQMHDSYIKAVSVQNQQHKVLRVGLMNTARPELYFWEIAERFTKACPEIQLELSSEYMTDLEADLASGRYDLIMVPDFERFTLESMELCWKWAACSRARLLMHKNHPLAGRESLSIMDVLYEKFATLEQKHRQTHLEDLEERMAPYHVKPTIVPGYKNAYEIKYLFRHQENMLLMTDEFFDCPDNPQLVGVPMSDQMNGVICAWNPHNQKPQLQKFIELLKPVRRGI